MRTTSTAALLAFLLLGAPLASAQDVDANSPATSPASPESAPEPSISRRPPPSFYMRITFGGGGGSVGETDDSSNPPIDDTIRGGSLGGSLSVGTRAGETFFLHADFWGNSVSGEGNVFQADARLLGAGLGVTYYIMPARVYFNFAPGIGMAFSRGPTHDYITTLGMAISVAVGWDWALGEGWSIGVEAQGRLYWTSDADLYLLSGAGMLAFVATYGVP